MPEKIQEIRCLDPERRAAVREHPLLNGIDFVEYLEDRQALPPLHCLLITFLKDDGIAGLAGHPKNFRIEGGTRIVGIEVSDVLPGDEPSQLKVLLSGSGDFSIYTLRIASTDEFEVDFLDERLSWAPFGFKSECPTEFDCRQVVECPGEPLQEPLLDYLAKDYASFQRLMLDLIPQRNPGWLERNPSDLGMALVDLLAYAGDHLSYYQDAVANEAFLDSCRQRISARRHSRLIDYRMHEGRNAWSFVHFRVGSVGSVPRGTPLLTRVDRPLQGQAASPGAVIEAGNLPWQLSGDAALGGVTVFETTVSLAVDPRNNRLCLHSWSGRQCCLPTGATGITLYGVDDAGVAYRPPLQKGDYLLLEEAKGPATGLRADADPEHRQVVRLETAQQQADPIYRDQLTAKPDAAGNPEWQLQPVTDGSQNALPVLKVTWRERDRLSFPLCLSSRDEKGREVLHVSLARGNVAPCDHGRRSRQELPAPKSLRAQGLQDLRLSDSPLTFQAMPANQAAFDDDGRPAIDRHDLDATPRQALPAVVLRIDSPAGESEIWTPVPDLLDSRAFDRHFVVEVDNRQRAVLRFGDDQYGRDPIEALKIQAIYRAGNGPAGNLGRESLVHVVRDASLPGWPDIEKVFQPLPAQGGVDAETIEQVRQTAPRAFHAEQFRAVTEEDYEIAVLKLAEVAAAKATFRWTGSWFTVFVAVHPGDPAQLITQAGGRSELDPEFRTKIRAYLTRFKLAGYDLRIRTARYVPLEVSIRICVAAGHFRGDVIEGVLRALGSRRFADGSVGFFHPSRFAFGQTLYLSRLYKVVEDVPGVESAVVETFKRYWEDENDELQNGLIPIGPAEIARLDNDPNFRENGVLDLTAVGGL